MNAFNKAEEIIRLALVDMAPRDYPFTEEQIAKTINNFCTYERPKYEEIALGREAQIDILYRYLMPISHKHTRTWLNLNPAKKEKADA